MEFHNKPNPTITEQQSMAKIKTHLLTEHGCMVCETLYPKERAALGYRTCTQCGEAIAKQESQRYAVVPMHKSNYVPITNKADLRGINNKGGFFR